MPPLRLTVPNVGRSPVAPQRSDGETIEPKVSVPMVKGNKPATTAAAEPADEPLEPCARFQGLRVSRQPFVVVAKAPNESFAPQHRTGLSQFLIH
jgi:hypothetical protein